MSVLLLRWQSATRIEALRALVAGRAKDWIAQWASQGAPVSVDIEVLPGPQPDAVASDARWFCLRDGGGVLSLRSYGACFEHLGCRLAGPASADSIGLASGIGRRALNTLARMFFAATAPASLTASAEPLSPSQTDARHGVIGLRMSIGAIRIDLYFDAVLCAALLPAATPARSPLSARRDAVKPIDATFDAVLDLGRTPLADSMAFKPGDVLKTSVPIGAAISINATDGTEILSGTLVADGNHRALEIVKTHLP